jgi:hypothetical protein
MRKQEIEELIRLVEESKITELEVSQGRTRIRISKNGVAVPVTHISTPAGGPSPLSAAASRRWKKATRLLPRGSWHQT